MKDAVRYTIDVPGGQYSAGVEHAVQELQHQGYQAVKWKPSWTNAPGDYKGINSFWKDPSTGQVFEVQFHTPQSFDAKMVTHELYEAQRLPGVSAEEIARLQAEQGQIFSHVPIPPGAGEIPPPTIVK
ncbi:hypothetical protein [Fodinicola feengrottensis]|uniref:hypothetical protein n=1 Tax=Fodinicola feengrottensis TaxID=435914 RepID=UPI0013D79241|nr:hypothetical protein [Fodinicola feengrottensis]